MKKGIFHVTWFILLAEEAFWQNKDPFDACNQYLQSGDAGNINTAIWNVDILNTENQGLLSWNALESELIKVITHKAAVAKSVKEGQKKERAYKRQGKKPRRLRK